MSVLAIVLLVVYVTIATADAQRWRDIVEPLCIAAAMIAVLLAGLAVQS